MAKLLMLSLVMIVSAVVYLVLALGPFMVLVVVVAVIVTTYAVY